MEKLFCTECRGEDLLRWSNNLDALGCAVSFLAYKDDDGEFLRTCGEHLGMVISDYAKAINETVGKACHIIDEFFKDESLSHDLKRELEILQRGYYCRADLDRVEKAIKRTEPFMIEVPLIKEMREAFLKIREGVVSEFGSPDQKRALP